MRRCVGRRGGLSCIQRGARTGARLGCPAVGGRCTASCSRVASQSALLRTCRLFSRAASGMRTEVRLPHHFLDTEKLKVGAGRDTVPQRVSAARTAWVGQVIVHPGACWCAVIRHLPPESFRAWLDRRQAQPPAVKCSRTKFYPHRGCRRGVQQTRADERGWVSRRR